MAKMGRPKAEKPIDKKVTVKFNEEEYHLLIEYAQNHNSTLSQVLRVGFEKLLKESKSNS